jgi:pimeloyl-ACP methyl ester carboxylesterase
VQRERRLVRANEVDLCAETFGDPGDPAILLIGGAASPMDWWDEEFCELLAGGPRLVVRYDMRDTGQSTTYEPGSPAYTGSDLVADAVSLLDALGIARAHLVGISMGGGIAQQLAVEHADRVASLTLMSTSPVGERGPDATELPPMSPRLESHFADPPPEPDWSDREAVVDYIVDDMRTFAGSLPFDAPRVRALAEGIVDRALNVESTLKNHLVMDSGEPLRGRLEDVRAPTLVIHGTEDPLFPFEHAEAFAAAIPGARLLPLEGAGHEVPPRPLWNEVVAAILEHTATRPEPR